ncbi:ATP-binding protein [Oceanivirga salmonicida]|uniref:ATP-binding protein n=1 Tax=Oceanivirga salmonicida TaxID=1769291 RepID=UPI0018CC6E01|nr:ATP-binding protein [Oceanivirga salmonicida]
MNSIELLNLNLRGAKVNYDELSSGISKDKASFTRLKSMYYYRAKKEFQENDLESFNLINKEGVLTNAGALFADEKLVYHSRIFCTRWDGLIKGSKRLDAIDDIEIEGSILIQFDEAMRFIRGNSKKKWKKLPTHRLEMPDYPERAYQEALVNAIVHRDYTQTGSEIHIDMYDDRLEIYSPGGMADRTKIQEKDIYNMSSIRRNPIIADVFSRMDLMERRGSGLKQIIETYKQQEMYNEELEPIFETRGEEFHVILKNLNYDTKDDTRDGTKDGTKRIEKILQLIKEDNKISIDKMAEEIEAGRRTIVRDIKYLQDNNILERIGGRKEGYWKVKDE